MVTHLPIPKINVTNILPNSLAKTTDASTVSFTDNLVELDTIRKTSEIRATGESISLPNYYRKSCQVSGIRFLDLPQLTLAQIWFPLITYWLTLYCRAGQTVSIAIDRSLQGVH